MNRLFSDIEPASLALATLILLVAALLGYREWLDRLGRPSSIDPEDHDHLRRRDRRRSLGLSILCLLALGILVGSRLPIRLGLRANPWFLGVWLGIFVLILGLLALALVDWVDLRRYAQRKKTAIRRDHLTIIQAQIDQWQERERGGDDLSRGSGGETG